MKQNFLILFFSVGIISYSYACNAAAAAASSDSELSEDEASRRIQRLCKRNNILKKEESRRAKISNAAGLFSSDKDDIQLGSIRSAARAVFGYIDTYMDWAGVPLSREAQKLIKNGEVDSSEMPMHLTIYKKVLERFTPDDSPWVRPKDAVMYMKDEASIRGEIEALDAIIAEGGHISRAVRRFNGIDPEISFSELLPKFE